MTKARETFLLNILDEIEQREARLLAWGIVDGYFSAAELIDLIDAQIDDALDDGFDDFLSANKVVDELLALQWIAPVELENGATAYRSRMAETVRLLSRLRQLFPKYAGDAGWQRAPTLVADFRFLRRQRRYPKRNRSVADALAVLRNVTSSTSLLQATRALLTPGGHALELAGFQVRAAERIVRGIENNVPLATIVCAGTGSGKTLAFYLPALASITRHLLAESVHKPWVKAIALYPRVELLKDQLREVLRRALALRQDLPSGSQTTIRVGAYFGDTPHSAQKCDWPSIGNDRVCTALNCLKCEGQLRWRDQDLRAGRERLTCANCSFEIDGEMFPLTRETLKKRPPDVLFTTTEMLNQRLSDSTSCHLFGVGPKAARSPELVLLDEVHTYEGRHGAQVAYLMRRWQRLLEQPLQFVGLSATLREATTFFAALTGCRPNLVEEVSPQSLEIEPEGAEYQLALRGDPVSRAALLSTTIQTTMLLQRCLDPKTRNLAESISAGVFGQKTFVFTDNLDVINRLYFDLLSAEGRNSYGDPDTRHAPDGGLAYLRRQSSSHFRYVNGQDWRVCEKLHGNLKQRLSVKRVSSQDRGVDPTADVVVATAVLEVGFDDPAVGAVVQHKAPRGMASFLQRKGRAGRTRGMRPWTAVVLSDYGRDRTAYQSYDLLFDPELPVRTLPMANRYLMRMQAVYATIDYLGLRLQDAPSGSVWLDLSGPTGNAQRRSRLRREVQQILQTDAGTSRLADYIERALKLSSDEVSALLWEYPRPLMTTVLPTALRRLATSWSADNQPGQDYQIANNPLPDFIPASLFADLNLAEVAINLSQADRAKPFEQPAMSIFAALREFAPGRVSRRYGVRHKSERYWLAPTPAWEESVPIGEEIDTLLDISAIGQHVHLGDYLVRDGDNSVAIPVYRPLSITPKAPPKPVKDSSNAILRWHSQFVPKVEPTWLSPPAGGIWPDVIAQVGFFTHSRHAPIEVRRFATGSAAEIGVEQEKTRANVTFALGERPVALGANFAADGVLFQLRIPADLYARQSCGTERKWQALRLARFTDQAWRGKILTMLPSPFAREWVAQIYLSALTYVAVGKVVSLESAARALAAGTADVTLTQVLDAMFQSQIVEAQQGEGHDAPPDKLRLELDDYLRRPDVLDHLHIAGRMLWEPIKEDWEPWLQGVYHTTMAAAIMRTVTDLCPTIDTEDLNVDLSRGAVDPVHGHGFNPHIHEIWLTEKTPGGSGLIEQIMARYAEDPRRFFSVVRANLGTSEFELIDRQMAGLLRLLTQEPDAQVAELIREFRTASDHAEMTKLVWRLRSALVEAGFSPFHGFIVSMGNRILRQGAGPQTDNYLASVLARWDSEETRLGVEIDVRVMSYFLSQSNEIDHLVSEFSAAIGTDRSAWRVSAINGLLWGRGKQMRQTALQLRNAFCELPTIERLLVTETIADDRVRVDVTASDWLEQTAAHLAAGRLVTLACNETQHLLLGDALNALVTNPIDAGYLRAYARLQGIRQSADALEADIELIEALQ
ncbi:protein DpdJ [Caballeronia sp. Lep1P3]|uniref:protein DpdJ n=1 Tax=Caballeronia sp. Lep1P3 TaxID=2878150 RepID=UPI001FD0F4B3|nr:protein DpdJ [Caballeronia sp. Lep1P3]